MDCNSFDDVRFAGAIRVDLGAIFVSMELSRLSWLLTSLSPGAGEKLSRHSVKSGDLSALFAYFERLQEKVRKRMGRLCPVIVIQEAGLDGFWIHRALEARGLESHVVDPASIAVPRRRRRAKTDRIDGEAMMRTLLAYKRGEVRVCAMVRPPSVPEEDRRRLVRERKVLIGERIVHTNRIKGLLFAQGVRDYQPLRRDRRVELERLHTGDGRALPGHLRAQISRELDRLDLLLIQIRRVEAERDALLAEEAAAPSGAPGLDGARPSPVALLMGIKGIGPEFTASLYTEGFYRSFDNRRQVAAYAGLAPSPWRSGQVDREQGISKAGNPRLRTTMIQLAWLWLRHQPGSALARWFQARVAADGGRRKKTHIVALARKLLVALWRYVRDGVALDGVESQTR